MNTKLNIIGHISSVYKERSECPKQATLDSPAAKLVLKEEYLPAIKRLRPGQLLEVITWFHLSSRDLLQCHPRGDENQPLHGVFATRAPSRPNPLGLHQVRLLGIENNILHIHPIDALDGTPVVDIKPCLSHSPGQAWGPGICAEDAEKIRDIARDAWKRGLLSGFNGNLSLRREPEPQKGQQTQEDIPDDEGQVIITASGSAKGRLKYNDLVLVDLQSKRPVYAGHMSSETPLHLAVYSEQPRARAIIHTHPPHLLALWLKNKDGLLQLPLYEVSLFVPKLSRVAPLSPGSQELAQATGAAAKEHEAIFLENHGLVCWAEDLSEALALTEELESLARIQLLSGI